MSKVVEHHVLSEYKLIREMGSGAYGHVWQVIQLQSGRKYALKKIFDAFRNSIDAQRTYRQIQVLSQIDHQNIIKIHKVLKSKNKKDLYIIFQLMESDLHQIVGTNILTKIHLIFVLYQILQSIKYVHSAMLIHRDLKPSNILINSQCKIKLCDFGLVRALSSHQFEEIVLSEEVATKWYRAPQLLLGSRNYSKPVDLWSFGCIAAELLIGKPLFAGCSTLNQLQKILEYSGSVTHQDIESLETPVAEQLVAQIKVQQKSFKDYFGGVDPDFHELLQGVLIFNPHKRLTVDEALRLSIFDEFREQIPHLKTCPYPIYPAINDNKRLTVQVYRNKIYEDIDKRYPSLQRVKLKEMFDFNNKRKVHSKTKSNSKWKSKSQSGSKTLSENISLKKHRSKIISNAPMFFPKNYYNLHPIIPTTKTKLKKKKGLPKTAKDTPNIIKHSPMYVKQNRGRPVSQIGIKWKDNSKCSSPYKLIKKGRQRLQESEKKEILRGLGVQRPKSVQDYMK